MEGGRGVAKAESHDKGFKKAKGAFEGGFPFITFFDAYVVITPSYVKFGKVAGSLEFVYEFWDKWERGGIFNSKVI